MKHGEGEKREAFEQALKGKRIPILTLDNKWYKLLTEEARAEVAGLEEELNALLKRQGKLNNDVKNIKRLKKKLMGEIVSLVDEAEQEGKEDAPQKIEQNKKLVEDCNQRLEGYQDELLELPREIEQANFKLMLATMDYCYDTMQENGADIQEIAQWVTEVRIELKKRLIRKQEMEQRNNAIYSYMHDVFGAEVIEIFDMKYNPDQRESGAGEE
ncbi:hypothetical protein D7X48_05885 [bacterium D16-50]|nr:hypothetical protein D7X48_05885 [bacterium D16-50]